MGAKIGARVAAEKSRAASNRSSGRSTHSRESGKPYPGTSLSENGASHLSKIGRSCPLCIGFGKYKVLIAGFLIVMAGSVLMAVILIVEDNGFVRETAEMWLQDLGHHTLSANNVDEALSLLRSPQHIDALFTDIYLKPLFYGGCDLANQAVALRPKLRVLYTTGSSIEDKVKTMLIEGTRLLPKPYTQDQLQNSIKELLAA